MASIHQDNRSGKWILMFRWGGRQYRRSTGTASKSEALSAKARAEETLRLLKLARIEIPPDADPGLWVMSDGKLNVKLQSASVAKPPVTLASVVEGYFNSLPLGAKADSSIKTERIHARRIQAILGAGTTCDSLGPDDLQRYVRARLTQSGRKGKMVQPITIRKELQTLKQIWDWGRTTRRLTTPFPMRGADGELAVRMPKSSSPPPFRSWQEIEQIISRGGLSDAEVAELWESVWLTDDQVAELLEYIRTTCPHRFVYVMATLVAFTGARRSEVCRSQIEDFRFDAGVVQIREKKRKHRTSQSWRTVPMHQMLRTVMEEWFREHPGGRFAITIPGRLPRGKSRDSHTGITVNEAHYHFRQALRDSRWAVVRGFHVLRHSIASNLARKGVDQRHIDSILGHQTAEMRERYQHLRPQDMHASINALAAGNLEQLLAG